MQVYRPSLAPHRLRRLVLWTLAMLQWIAAIVCGKEQAKLRHKRQRADESILGLERMVADLVIVRALHIARPRRRRISYWHRGRNMRPRHMRRSILGASLRRAFKHKDLATRIARLIAVLRNLDAHAARLAHCMRHRRRRLWFKAPPIAPAQALRAPTPAFANTS